MTLRPDEHTTRMRLIMPQNLWLVWCSCGRWAATTYQSMLAFLLEDHA